jgi:hypothetical protein
LETELDDDAPLLLLLLLFDAPLPLLARVVIAFLETTLMAVAVLPLVVTCGTTFKVPPPPPGLEGLLGGTILGRLLSWDSRRFQSRIGRDETMKLAMVALRQPSVVRTATDVKGKTLK